jgi:hypothetical protein
MWYLPGAYAASVPTARVSAPMTHPLSSTVRLELEPGDAALVSLALERLADSEGSSPTAGRATVIAAYLRLERHKALRSQAAAVSAAHRR